jgi:hypothetical protein
MDDRVRLMVSIAVLAIATAINAASGRAGVAIVCGAVLVVVVVVRLVLPALQGMRTRDRSDR